MTQVRRPATRLPGARAATRPGPNGNIRRGAPRTRRTMAPGGPPPAGPAGARVPGSLAVAAAWSWRLLAVGAAGWFLIAFLWGRLSLVVVPVLLGLLLAALLHRPVVALRRVLPRWLAALSVVVVALAVLAAVGWFVEVRISSQYASFVAQSQDVLDRLQSWITRLPGVTGPSAVLDRLGSWLRQDGSVVSSAVTAGRTALEVLTALVLTAFLTLFFLIDGDRMWSWVVRLMPRRAQPAVNGAGHRAFRTLSGWVSGTALIALIHGVVIGLALWLLGTPLVFVLAVLVFLGSFVPIVGAFVCGGLAVLVTLLTGGLGSALVLLAVLLAEDLLEGHVYQPLIMRRAVQLHPVVVLVALTAGSVLGGVMGALVAIPVAAAVHAAVKYLTGIEDIDGNPLRDEDRMAPEPPPRAIPRR